MKSYMDILLNVNTIASDDLEIITGLFCSEQSCTKFIFQRLNIPVLKFIQDGYHCFRCPKEH